MGLVFSSSLVLPEAEAALPAGVPLILWDNLVTFSNIVADTEAVNHPATEMANPATNLYWLAEDTTEQYVTASLNTMVDVDSIGLAGHNFGSAGIAVSVERDVGAGFVEVIAPFIPANDEPILGVFTGASLVDIRIKLATGTAPARISSFYAGKLLRCERGFDIGAEYTPPRFARKTETIHSVAHRGHYLSSVVTSESIAGATATFKHFSADWYRTYFDPFVRAARRGRASVLRPVPFFYAGRPVAYPREVAYAWLPEDPTPMESPITGRMGVSIKMDGIVE